MLVQNAMEKTLLGELSDCDGVSDAGNSSDTEDRHRHDDLSLASTTMLNTPLMRFGDDVGIASSTSPSEIAVTDAQA